MVIVLDVASSPVIYVALFLLGTGETLADNATGTLVVRVVPHHQLGTANARLSAVFTVGNQLAGPPLGAGCLPSVLLRRSAFTLSRSLGGLC